MNSGQAHDPAGDEPATRDEPTRLGTLVALCVALLLLSRTFQYFPNMALVQEAAIVAAPVALALLLVRHRGVAGRTPLFEGYVLFLMVAMPLWSGFAALSAYGQPVVFGTLAWRGYWLSAFALFILYATRARLIKPCDVDKAFIICAWSTLILFLLMNVLLDPANYVEYGIGFIEDRDLEGYRFKFSQVFALYALFHYIVRGLRESRFQWYLVAGVFASFLVGSAGGRTLTVSAVLALLVVLLHWGGWVRVWRGAASLVALLVVVFGVSTILAPAATEDRLDKFADAFAVFSLNADEIDDSSAAARALQILAALPMVEEHPIMGNGRISSQWIPDGYQGYLGAYFFPDDIGVVGVLLQFGMLGTVVLTLQFMFAWAYVRQIGRPRSSVGSDTVEIYIAYLAISSLATGAVVMFPEFCLLLVAMLLARSEWGDTPDAMQGHGSATTGPAAPQLQS